jgi:hypothetical protein
MADEVEDNGIVLSSGECATAALALAINVEVYEYLIRRMAERGTLDGVPDYAEADLTEARRLLAKLSDHAELEAVEMLQKAAKQTVLGIITLTLEDDGDEPELA